MKIKKTKKQKTKLVISTLAVAAVAVPVVGFTGLYVAQQHDSYAKSQNAAEVFQKLLGEQGTIKKAQNVQINQSTVTGVIANDSEGEILPFEDPEFARCADVSYQQDTKQPGLPWKEGKEAVQKALSGIRSLRCGYDIDTGNPRIGSLTGMEHMTGLNAIDLSGNFLPRYQLEIAYKQVIQPQQENLNTLNLSDNELWEDFYLDKAINLDTLNVSNTQMRQIHIENSKNLSNLDISHNQFTELNVANSPSLKYLFANDNQLAAIDLSNNQNLDILDLGENQLKELNVAGLGSLQDLYVNDNHLNKIDLSGNQSLESLDLSSNQFEEFDTSGLKYLAELDMSNNKLSSIDLSQNNNLETVLLYRNKLTTIGALNNSALKFLGVWDNELTDLNLSGSQNLMAVGAWDNQLTNLNVSNTPNLLLIGAWSNKMKSMELSDVPQLRLMALDDILVKTNIMTDQIAGARDFDLSTFRFIGQLDLSKPEAMNGPLPKDLDAGTTFVESPYYTFDLGKKILAVNDLEGTNGYAQVVPYCHEEVCDQEVIEGISVNEILQILPLTYKLQLASWANPDIPVPHTDGGNPAAPNTGFGSATTIVAAASIAVPTLIASLLVTRAIRNRKRGHIKFD